MSKQEKRKKQNGKEQKKMQGNRNGGQQIVNHKLHDSSSKLIFGNGKTCKNIRRRYAVFHFPY